MSLQEEIIQNHKRLNFENEPSRKQSLSHISLKREFDQHDLKLDSDRMKEFKLVDSQNRKTNLAYLLSEQCDYSVKLDVFKGKDYYSEVILKKEYFGGLLKQIADLLHFFELNCSKTGDAQKMTPIASRELPMIAAKEALINMMVHRDYSYRASAFIRIFEDRVEFVSLGGLVSQLTLEDIQAGISIPRNPNLAHLIHFLGYSDNSGLGLGRIQLAYQDYDVQPTIERTAHTFKVVLPFIPAHADPVLELGDREKLIETIENEDWILMEKKEETDPALKIRKEMSDEEKVLKFAKTNGSVNRNEVIALLMTSASSANRVLRRLVQNKKLQPQGKARNTSYTIIE